MPNLAARTAFPYIETVMHTIGVTEKSAVALQKLRQEANQTRPGNVTIQKLVYDYGLAQKEMVLSLVKVFNFHLEKLKKPILNDQCVVDFNCYIKGFGPCMNTLETEARDPENDPIASIAAISGYAAEVIVSLKKGRLVPFIIANDVLDAAKGFKFSGSLNIERVQLNDFSRQPVAVEAGRGDIFRHFAQKKLDIYQQI